MITQIQYAKLKENAIPPTRKNPTDAGIDFYSYDTVTIPPNDFKIISTGITMEVPENYMLLIKPKSKNNHLIGAGIIDAYYHPGEVLIKIVNVTTRELHVNYGDAIAQGIYIPVETPELHEVTVNQLDNNSTRSKQGGIVNEIKTN